MVEFVEGNLMSVEADIRVNTVNCVGVMGTGVAAAFRERYAQMYRQYRKDCAAGLYRPGSVHEWRTLMGEWVLNVATKDDWRDPSRIEWVESILAELRAYLAPLGPVRVALPALGCGHGRLKWSEVAPRIEAALGDLEAQVLVFPPAASQQFGRDGR